MLKSIHIDRADGLLKGRDAIWQCIRELKTFTLVDIEIKSTDEKTMDNINGETARLYVKCLEKAGYLKRLPRASGVHARVSWQLIKDVGIHAPRIKRDGTEVTHGSSQQQMWQTMRMLKSFSAEDLIINASTPKQAIKKVTVNDYVHHLHKAGYLRLVSPAHNGGGIARYSLLSGMNTGPKPPMIQRIKQVFDANLNKIVWPKPKQEDV